MAQTPSSTTIHVHVPSALSLAKLRNRNAKLCISRMVDDAYTVIWDAQNPVPYVRFTFPSTYYVAAGEDKPNDQGQAKLLTEPLPICPGQTAIHSGLEALQSMGNPDPNARNFQYFNSDTKNTTRAVVLQELVVTTPNNSGQDGAGVNGGSGARSGVQAAVIDPPGTTPTTEPVPISFSVPVKPGSGTIQVTPRWNVYAGDGSGAAVDSIALWWAFDSGGDAAAVGAAVVTGSGNKAGSTPSAGPPTTKPITGGSVINSGDPNAPLGPSLSDVHTTMFSVEPGKSVNVTWQDAGWGEATISDVGEGGGAIGGLLGFLGDVLKTLERLLWGGRA